MVAPRKIRRSRNPEATPANSLKELRALIHELTALEKTWTDIERDADTLPPSRVTLRAFETQAAALHDELREMRSRSEEIRRLAPAEVFRAMAVHDLLTAAEHFYGSPDALATPEGGMVALRALYAATVTARIQLKMPRLDEAESLLKALASASTTPSHDAYANPFVRGLEKARNRVSTDARARAFVEAALYPLPGADSIVRAIRKRPR